MITKYANEQHLNKDPLTLNGTYVDPTTGTRIVSTYGKTEEAKTARIGKMQKENLIRTDI